MEQEYKWIIEKNNDIDFIIKSDLISKYLKRRNVIFMEAIYYDDNENTLKNMHGALRVRKEDTKSICCLKLEKKTNNKYKIREEYELEDVDIYNALKRFPTKGAPNELCQKLGNETLIELCKITFKREIHFLEIELDNVKCEGELDFDVGIMNKNENKNDFRELEFEYKSGDIELFHKYANLLEKKFNLKVQPLSKIARTMKL